MREYFGDQDEPDLPPPLAQWLESGSPTLARRLDDRRLTVERSTDALLLKETRDELAHAARTPDPGLGGAGEDEPRDRADPLVAPSTVRKHLENVYAKLDVHTRTAAAARARPKPRSSERVSAGGRLGGRAGDRA
jgi:hypothetical protein